MHLTLFSVFLDDLEQRPESPLFHPAEPRVTEEGVVEGAEPAEETAPPAEPEVMPPPAPRRMPPPDADVTRGPREPRVARAPRREVRFC